MSNSLTDLFTVEFKMEWLKGNQPLTPIALLVDEHLRDLPDKDDEHRDDRVWHASSVSHDFCPRYETINAVVAPVYRPQSVTTPSSHRVYDIGKALHSWWQNQYLGAMQALWGIWESSCCGQFQMGFRPPQETAACPNCGARRRQWVNCEFTLHVPVHRFKELRGHCDGLMWDYQAKAWSLLELKTINPFDYMKLKEPNADHVDQVTLYLYALRCHSDQLREQYATFGALAADELVNVARSIDVARLVYIDKSSGKNKEFFVPFNAERAEILLNRMRMVTDTVDQYQRTGSAPLPEKHGHCQLDTDEKVKKCHFKHACMQCSQVEEVTSFYNDKPLPVADDGDVWDTPVLPKAERSKRKS